MARLNRRIFKRRGTLAWSGAGRGASGRKIVVGGGVHAKYLTEVEIEAGGDIVIESEIIHSILKTRGRLHMPDGRLIGGEVMALMGIELGEAGSVCQIPTRLIAGEDYCLVAELKPKNEELSRQRVCLEKIRGALASLIARKNTLDSHQRETLTEIYYQEENLAEVIARLQQEIQDLKANAQNLADANRHQEKTFSGNRDLSENKNSPSREHSMDRFAPLA